MGNFFKNLMTILRWSKEEEFYLDEQGTTKFFFDQDIFQFCLRHDSNQRMHLLKDTNKTTNLLDVCAGHVIKETMVSNLLISSYAPPVVYDSTICIHPLDLKPFTPFRKKLATAKFLGFDPTEIGPNEKVLKTLSGDIVSSEHWNQDGFFKEELHKNVGQQQGVQRCIAMMIKLAQETNRTLILPRHIRDRHSRAYPTHSVVSIASIDSFVPWRFMTHKEAELWESQTTVVELEAKLEDSVHAVKSCNKKVCAIHGLYKNANAVQQDRELLAIISNLTWCFQYEEENFSISVGSYSQPCMPS